MSEAKITEARLVCTETLEGAPALSEHSIKRRLIDPCVLGLPLALCGCSQAGAPSIELFGAFFPAWLLCAVLGIFVAFSVRLIFAARGLTDVLPLQLFVCTSIGLIFALLVWLLWFGR